MTTFANDLTHPAVVEVDGKSFKLPAGGVQTFSGGVAEEFQAIADRNPGVRVLSGSEAKEALAARAADTVNPTESAQSLVPKAVAEAVGALGQLTVAAPLQVVIGDDLAPYGPGSGTISTKQVEAAKNPGGADRVAFADNEVLVGDPKFAEPAQPFSPVADTAAQVHESQRQARVQTERAIAELGLAGESADGEEGDEDEDVDDGLPDDYEGLKTLAEAEGVEKPGRSKADVKAQILAKRAEVAAASSGSTPE